MSHAFTQEAIPMKRVPVDSSKTSAVIVFSSWRKNPSVCVRSDVCSVVLSEIILYTKIELKSVYARSSESESEMRIVEIYELSEEIYEIGMKEE